MSGTLQVTVFPLPRGLLLLWGIKEGDGGEKSSDV